jgi:hypothetical protein
VDVTDNARALAAAVQAGDGEAIAGLMDEVQAEVDVRAAREWLRQWDRIAKQALDAIVFAQEWSGSAVYRMAEGGGDGLDKRIAKAAYQIADAMMAERAARLTARPWLTGG